MDRFRPGWVYDTTDQEPEQSDTIEGLAEKLGLDGKELKKTVDEYNAASVRTCHMFARSTDRKQYQ
jgi:hypothetical protein